MKTKKRFIFSILGIMLFSAFIISGAYYFLATADERNFEKRVAAEKKSIAAYNNIINSFAASGDAKYHDQYAGAYLDEKGNLVVLVAPAGGYGFDDGVSSILALAGLTDAKDIIFQEAEFTYAFLENLMGGLCDLFVKNHSDPDSIWSHVTELLLLDEKNHIAVKLSEPDEEKAKRFLAETGNPEAIAFTHAQKPGKSEEREAYDYHAGMRVNTGSIGFRARIEDVTGFVTAGHITSAGAPVFQAFVIGTCVEAIADSTLDAAFVRAGDVCIMSNRTYKGHVIAGINTAPVSGATVFKLGRATGLTRGRITSTNAAYLYTLFNESDTIIRTNIITADYLSKSGDSGGIVFDSQNLLLGIHLAGPPGGHAGNRAVEKIATIQDVLKVSFY